MKVIEFHNAWEKYRIKFIREGKVSWEEIWALEDICLRADKGEVLGVIGQNGAGKTTLLKLISGMLIPDRGGVNVEGRVSVLMELGAGFNPEFTGKENILLNAQVYGLDKETLAQQMEKIIEFADIGKFIDAPIKYYSQGMYMRLAFALAIFVEPDVLLIDDILAVGDQEAQQKCIKKIFELKEKGKTIILVSHDMNMVNKLCNRVILLEKGKIIQEGRPAEVIPYYLETVGEKKGIAVLEKEKVRLVFNNGRIIFDYGANLLTKGIGGSVVSFIPSINSWLSATSLNWSMKSFLSDRIVAEAQSQDGTISQIWTIELKDNYIQWEVEIKENVKETRINLILSSIYKKWVSLNKSGDFSPFAYKFQWQDLNLTDCPEGILGIMPEEGIEDIPSLVLEKKDKHIQTKLFNTGYDQEGRVIQWHLSINSKNSIFVRIFSERDKFKQYLKEAKERYLLKQQEEERKRRLKQQEQEQRLLLKQQQEQARLRASRTISQGNLRLFVDLENKSLRLYYKDKELTKGNGLHTSFLVNKRWHDNSSSEWQIAKEKEDLLVKFFWKAFELTQTYRFSLRNRNILWHIDSFANKAFNPQILKFGLSLSGAYKTFFCAHQQENLPEEFTIWQDIPLESPKASLFGLRKQNHFPAVVLENKQNLPCLIQNSNAESSCRTLQLSLPKQSLAERRLSFATKLNLLEEETPIEDYLKQEKQKLLKRQQEEERKLRLKQQEEEQRLLLKQQQEQARLRASRTISQGNLRLFADIETKSLRLYYKDREISKAGGLHSSFNVSKRWFYLIHAQWQIDKVSEKRLALTLDYEPLSLLQIWTLTYKDEHTLEIRIEIEVNKTIFLANQNVKLELQDKYKNWLTAYEKGSLLVNQYIDNIGPIRLKDNKVSKVVLRPKNENDFPELFFAVSSHLDRRIMGIYKHKEANEEYLCLNSSLIVPKKEASINAGRYTYFEGKVVLAKESKLEEETAPLKDVRLSKGNLRFTFDQGKGNIFWAGKELTAGLSAYTSVRCSGIWYDSYQATWKVKQKGNNKITVTGDWPHIPIFQSWQIELINRNLISWRVDMEIYEEVNLEIEQTNLMLSSEYKNWIVPGFTGGDFLDEYTQDYDILPFRFWYGKAERMIAAANTLPKIVFKSDLSNEGSRAIVENSDNLYQARLLQYQKVNNCNLLPSKYLYFKGVIEIAP